MKNDWAMQVVKIQTLASRLGWSGYSCVRTESAGTLISTVEKIPNRHSYSIQRNIKKTRHCYLIYENFSLGTLILGGTLIWYMRVGPFTNYVIQNFAIFVPPLPQTQHLIPYYKYKIRLPRVCLHARILCLSKIGRFRQFDGRFGQFGCFCSLAPFENFPVCLCPC